MIKIIKNKKEVQLKYNIFLFSFNFNLKSIEVQKCPKIFKPTCQTLTCQSI